MSTYLQQSSIYYYLDLVTFSSNPKKVIDEMAELCDEYAAKGELWAIYCRAVMFVMGCEAANRAYTRALQLRPDYAKLLMHRA